MKVQLSRNLWIFAVLNSLSTILFIICMKNEWFFVIERGENYVSATSWLPFLYAAMWFISGLILGSTDKARNSRQDLEFLYSVVTAVVSLVGIVLLGIIMPQIGIEAFVSLLLMFAVGFGILLSAQWLVSRRKIKGMNRKDLFR